MRKQAARLKFEVQEASSLASWPKFWFLRWEVTAYAKFTRLLLQDADLGLQNTSEMNSYQTKMKQRLKNWEKINVALPADFPNPRLALTNKNFAPDYFSYDSYDFCSQRLRDALAQAEDVVQFLPIDLVTGGEAVRAQKYKMMHILAQQPAMDIVRSDCRMSEVTHQVTGKRFKKVGWIDKIVLLDCLKPRTEIFHPEEIGSQIMVTDALAARVLQAGCTGLEFRDPEVPQHGLRVERIRTTTGIAERRIGFLD